MFRSRLAGQRVPLTVGLGLTTLAALVAAVGWVDRLEWLGYDHYVRHFSRIPASERILHIDVDDAALDRVASWPWPRDLQADLVQTLGELGASHIVTDLVWSEPRPPEWRTPAIDPYADLEGRIPQVGQVSEENLVFPDDELASAIRETGCVYLAMYHQDAVAQPDPAGAALEAQAIALLEQDFSLDADQLAVRMSRPAP